MAKEVRYFARRQFMNHGQLIERGEEVPQAARWRPAIRKHYCRAVEVEEPAQGGVIENGRLAQIGQGPETVLPVRGGRATGLVVEPVPAEPEPDLAPETEPEGADEAIREEQAAPPQVNTVSLFGVAKARGGPVVGKQESKRKSRRGE